MKAARILWLVGLALVLAMGTSAAATKAGASVLAIQLTHSDGDFVDLERGNGFVFPFRHSVMGVQLQYWYYMKDDYAVNVSTGVGFSKESDNPGVNALPGAEAFKDNYSAWGVRVGGDRVADVSDRFRVYAGPGIQVWGGQVEFKRGTTKATTATAVRLGLDGRIGVYLPMGESFGITGELGRYWAYASAKQAGAQSKWLPSGSTGSMGFAFSF